MKIKLSFDSRIFTKLYYTLILFFYLYAPQLDFIPNYNISKYLLVIVVAEALYLKVLNFKKYIIIQYILYGVLLIYTYINLFSHGTFDTQQAPVNQILTHILEVIVFCSFYVNILIKRGFTLEDLRNLAINVLALQGFIVVLELISFDFRSYMQGMIYRKAKPTGSFQWFRGLGFSWVQNYDFALFQSFGILLFVSKFLDKRKFTLIDIAKLIAILISVITAGRTGFIGIAAGLLVFFWKTANQGLFLKFVRFTAYTSILLVLFYNLSGVISPKVYSAVNNELLPWAFEFYYSFMETGELETASSTQLLTSHYFDIPDDVVLFGKGIYTLADGSYFNSTDAGYMRQIYYFGIFGILLFILLYSRIAIYYYNNADKHFNYIIPSIVILMIITHIKGDVFTNSLLLNRGLYFFCIAFLIPRKKEKKNKLMN